MSTPRSGAMATALVVLSVAVGVGIAFRGVFSALFSFTGVLAGANIVAAGVLQADDPVAAAAAVGPVLLAGARAVAALVRRHLTFVGLVMSSSAVTVVSGEAGPVLCFGMFVVFLLSLALINIGGLG